MKLTFELIINLIHAIFWGAVLLVLAAFVLPEKIFRKVLKNVKPDLVSKSALVPRLRLVFDYLFNNKEVIFDESAAGAPLAMQERIATLLQEKRLLEGSLFFLDLLQNLSQMINFAALHSGHSPSGVCELLGKSMEYLQYYSKQLRPSSTSQNIEERVSLAAAQLERQVGGIAGFLQNHKGEEKLEFARTTIKHGAEVFDTFMKGEYQSTKKTLIGINQLLADEFMAYIGGAT